MVIEMNPIQSPLFHDFPKFVYQTPDIERINSNLPQPKPFSLKPPEKAKKTKKDTEKENQPPDKEKR